ncbi:hypothetical protein [Hyphomicrobium sp. DY-1]|uniref:hypothetical protein n=1 Tax=Hyphomicrobium sp. DY-1 TaxID=3075650 RepID=UPI0039C461DA
MQRSFAKKVADHPIVIFWAAVILVVSILNFSTGLKTGGFPLALAFVSMAMLGAYAAHELEKATGVRRSALTIMVVLQLILGQWCGWQTIGINLSQGATGLDTAANTHNTVAEQLAQAKGERERIAAMYPDGVRTIAAIEADEHLECESGVGPLCTGFRKELANAKRVAELDGEIPGLVAQLGNAPQLADSNAPYSVARSFGSAIGSIVSGKPVQASRDDVIFWFEIFVVFALEFVGTCGPWLFRIGEKWADPEPPKSAIDEWDFGPPRLTHQSNSAAGTLQSSVGGPHAEGDNLALRSQHGDNFVARGRGGVPQGSPAGVHTSAGADGLNRPQLTPASNPSEQHQHGAPITVNLYGQHGAQAAPAPAPTPLIPIDTLADQNVSALRAVTHRKPTEEEIQSVREAPDRPVDNSELINLLHGLNGFVAACLVPQQGSWIDAAQVYQRYKAWAQERACSEEAFHSLFPTVSKVKLHLAGGVPHYAGVALKRLQIAKEAS